MKGGMVSQFKVNQTVEFNTSIRHNWSKGGQNEMTKIVERGTIVKLHKSGKSGSAIIRRFAEFGGGRVTRRLIHVRAI